MADTVEMQDIRGLDIDKTVKGFALIEYMFKKDCSMSNTSADSIRWYQETAADLEATAPSQVANIDRLSNFTNLEVSWTRNVSYVRKYAAEGTLSMEDMKSADIDVLARTLLRLTRAVVKQVDTRIFNVLTESLSPTNIQTFATTAVGGDQWDAASDAGDPLADLLHARYLLENQGYDASQAVCYLHPIDARNLFTWLTHKGAQFPSVAANLITGNGTLANIYGITIKTSVNVTQDNAVVFLPRTACTWKTFQDTTSRVIENPGIGSTVRVWEIGEAILTDPKAVVLITDLQT